MTTTITMQSLTLKKNQEERDKIEEYVFQKIYELKQQETN